MIEPLGNTPYSYNLISVTLLCKIVAIEKLLMFAENIKTFDHPYKIVAYLKGYLVQCLKTIRKSALQQNRVSYQLT